MASRKLTAVTGVVIEKTTLLTLEDICNATHSDVEIIIRLVDDDLISPHGDSPDSWQFDDLCLKRAKLATSFHRDLEVNMAGVGLALDLLERIDELQADIERLKQ